MFNTYSRLKSLKITTRFWFVRDAFKGCENRHIVM